MQKESISQRGRKAERIVGTGRCRTSLSFVQETTKKKRKLVVGLIERGQWGGLTWEELGARGGQI